MFFVGLIDTWPAIEFYSGLFYSLALALYQDVLHREIERSADTKYDACVNGIVLSHVYYFKLNNADEKAALESFA